MARQTHKLLGIAAMLMLGAWVKSADSQFATQCSNGLPIYSGPNQRLLCGCSLGWKGPNCNLPFTEKDWGPFKLCKQEGKQDVCDKGLQCYVWKDFSTGSSQLRCTCDPGSKNPLCNTRKNLACTLAGCERGLNCTDSGCLCAPFSSNPLCKCDGQVTNVVTNTPTPCTLGKDGYCVITNEPDAVCDGHLAFAPAPPPDTCPLGTQYNALGQCACVPLSANPKCAPPAVNQKLNNVCAQFGRCTKPFGVTYAVYQGDKMVTSGKAKVDPQRNYLIVTSGIVAGQKYNLCVGLQSSTGWTFNKQGCASVDSAGRCCEPVTANKGPTNFSAGCAQYAGIFSNMKC